MTEPKRRKGGATPEELARVADIREELAPAAQRVMNATVAILRDGSDDLDPIGSGVLLRIEDAQFILTSAHVVDQFRGKVYVQLGGQAGTTRASGAARFNGLNAGLSRQNDPIDVAALRLDENSRLPPDKSFLTLDDLVIETPTSPETLILGYPIARTKLQPGRYLAVPLLYATHLAPFPKEIVKHFDLRVNVAAQFNKRSGFAQAGMREMPKWHGMSGGGMWSVAPSDEQRPSTAKLFAIFNEISTRHLAIGTSVRMHLFIIGMAWEDMRISIRQRSPNFATE